MKTNNSSAARLFVNDHPCNQKIMPTSHRHLPVRNAPLTHVLSLLLGLLCAGFSSSALSNCIITTSLAEVDLGQAITGSLPLGEVPNYQQMGTRQFYIHGNCDQTQKSISLAFQGLQPGTGEGLIRWGEAGALLMRIERASVEGVDVPIAIAANTSGTRQYSVRLTKDSTVSLELTGLPPQARKSFSLQVSVAGLIPAGYTPLSQMRMHNRFHVQQIEAD